MASKFNDETQQIVIEALKSNPSIYSAAAAANITYPTLMKWLTMGEEGQEGYTEFLREVEQARSTVKDEIVASLYEIACDRLHPQAVKAAKELLSCLYPREFSLVRHVVQHKTEDPELDLSKLSQAEKRAFHKTLKQIVSGDDDTAAITVVDVTAQKAEA
jgi:glutamate/tyrosine decarboxylase-like PLP-dependent enzyme